MHIPYFGGKTARVIPVLLTALAIAALSAQWRWGVVFCCILLLSICGWFVISHNGSWVVGFTAPLFFLFMYTIYVMIPVMVSFMVLEGGIVNKTWWFKDDRILFGCTLGLVAFTLGGTAIRSLGGHGLSMRLAQYRQESLSAKQGADFWIPVLAVASVSTAMTVVFFFIKGDVYLQILAAEQIGHQRQALRSGAGYFTMHFVYVLPWITLLFYLASKTTKKPALRVGAITLGTLSLLAQVALLYRGNVVFFLLMFIVADTAVDMKTSRKSLKWLGFAIAFFLALTSLRVLSNSSPSSGIATIGNRIVQRSTTPMLQLGYVLDTFPRDQFFPGENYWIDMKAWAPGPDRSFNGIIYTELGGYGHGTATTTILGESYAALGFAGIAIVLFALGAAVQAMHQWLVTGRKEVFRVFLYSILTIYVGKVVMGSLTQTLVPRIIALCVIAVPVVLTSVLIQYAFARRSHVGTCLMSRRTLPFCR